MSKNYGTPYKGSKNSIAEWVLQNLPPAETLYDLFGGGGAISHIALESGKYDKVVYNELNKNIAQLFCNAVHGLYKDRTEWVSREDFKALKDIDPYVATIWSFGNNLSNYMYSAEIEPWKKALHYAIVFEDYRYIHQFGIDFTLLGTDSHTRRLEARKIIKENKEEFKKKYMREVLKLDDTKGKEKIKTDRAEEKARLQKILRDALKESGLKASDINRLTNTDMAGHWFGNSQWQFPTEDMYNIIRTKLTTLPYDYKLLVGYYNQLCSSLESLERLQSLESLQRLESLESLERLQSLESLESLGNNLIVYAKDYREIPITSNSVIYCDIPYKNTDAYLKQQFDYKAFYDWCCKQEVPVYISEYTLDDDRFEVIAEKEKRVLYSATNSGTKTEKLFKVKGR